MSNERIADQGPLSKVNPFRVMTVMARAQHLESQGRRIVHMEAGEPDFSSAQPIIDAGKRALDDGLTQYTAATGLAQLRECLSVHYRENYNVEVDANRILITPGASGGLNLLANLLVRAGDGVLLSDPAYPCVRNFIHMMSAQPQLIPVGIEQNFQPTLEQLDEYCTDKTSGLWLASPSNPTGTILERSKLKEACNWAASRQKHLLVDEIYHGLHYVDDLPSVLELDQSAFVVNSFSKYFGMTGWRLGWIVVPQEHVEMATILAQNMYISASSISQYAALAAFTPEAKRIFEERREAFRLRRDFLAGALKSMGFSLSDNIQGAFYIYADISKFSDDCEIFCRDMLEDHGVALTPGTDFGDFQSKRHVRIAFTTDMDSLELGVQRLQNALL
ncbi:MAG: aminotransferase class I/II-fold pyridoxal phosphate-dependent enzyme [Proteobacteria bacterium]|nr:aminotransferase class I/II-fold pyridoxal phosphate-dependent enzyme [Pseudomonadota bacterium]MDA1289772.1 aminotransferase class I/II-fold pyridoxal phosphate-dependent enzyme [Pseudomonadota bacterium]